MDDYKDQLEKVIVLGLLDKSERIQSWVYDYYSPALYGQIIKQISDEDIAGECLKSVFVTIFKTIDKYDGTYIRLFTWFLRITRITVAKYQSPNMIN